MFKISALLFLLASTLFSQSVSSFTVRLNRLLENKYFDRSFVSVEIYDFASQKNLYSRNTIKLIRPASILKLFTAAAAVRFLGSNYRFKTELFFRGSISDSTLNGDLFFVGSGDPEFTDIDFDGFISALKKKGIREINGNIYGDVSAFDSLYWGNGWMWDDDPDADFPYFTPLITDNAAVEVIIKPGQIGKKAEVETFPESDYFELVNNTVTTREDTSDFEVTRNWIQRGNKIMVSGDVSYREDTDTTRINLLNPAIFFLYRFAEKLNSEQINFVGSLDTLSLPDSVKKMFSFSRPLKDILKNMLRESDNLSAEMTLRALATEYFGKPASAVNGVKLIDSLIILLGDNPHFYKIVDGSGVSHYNLISSELVLRLLQFIEQNSEFKKHIYSNLPLAGKSGTLRNRMRSSGLLGNVRAKTGTLSGVSNLAGYMTAKSGHELAFVIMMQNFVGKHKIYRWFQDKICQIIYEMN